MEGRVSVEAGCMHYDAHRAMGPRYTDASEGQFDELGVQIDQTSHRKAVRELLAIEQIINSDGGDDTAGPR